MLFSLDTPAREMMDRLVQRGFCAKAWRYLGRFPHWTLREYIAISEMDPDAKSQSWFEWAFKEARDLFDREARLFFLRNISDHGVAATMYEELDGLYQEEIEEMFRTFKLVLPEVVRRIEAGEIVHKPLKG